MRRYGEFCPLARALDLVGERWTMLIVRELALGPRRFTDLRGGLPGIATNLLAERLRFLEEAGVLERHEVVLPLPGVLYRLTERGEALKPILRDLARWGAPLMLQGQGDDAFSGRWLLFLAEMLYSDVPTENVAPLGMVVSNGAETVSILVERDSVRIEPADDPTADVRIESDPSTLFAILSGQLTPDQAEADGRAVINGSKRARKRMVTLAARVGLITAPS
jgi:DNA-binding HxlR family transcriptional regulator